MQGESVRNRISCMLLQKQVDSDRNTRELCKAKGGHMKFEEGQAPIYTVYDVADMLQISHHTVRNWARTKNISSTKYGREFRFSESDVQRFVERSRIEHVEPEAVPT